MSLKGGGGYGSVGSLSGIVIAAGGALSIISRIKNPKNLRG